jgi:hypothetical protein
MEKDQTKTAGGSYKAYRTLWRKLKAKASQLSECRLPIVVAIGSFHNESLTLFDDVLIDEYLSAFFQEPDRTGDLLLNAALEAISAFVLIGFGYNEYTITGCLNPSPVHHFDTTALPDVPFRKMSDRGLREKTGEGEWVILCPMQPCPSFRHPLPVVEFTGDCA